MSNASEATKNDRAWEKLFEKYSILQAIDNEGCFEITAAQINEFREARLMTKFDHRINLPGLFARNRLSILPVTRGSYVMSRFDAYKDFEDAASPVQRVSFPDYIESIDYENITSEAMAINCGYVSGIFADFLEDGGLLPTVSGRMSSSSFTYSIKNIETGKNITVNVVNSQIEIDGGFEGLNTLSIVEAKNFISDDFLVRQLYYPFRLWKNNVAKRVKPIFLVYSNGIFSLYEYNFTEPQNYNSLVLVKHKKYCIDAVEISLDEILAVLHRATAVKEPEIAFPQADSFKRVVNLCELLADGEKTRDDITLNYAFDTRQTNYYTDAGRYLGLIDKKNDNRMTVYSLSGEGRRLLKLKYRPRQLKLAELILRHTVFMETLKRYLEYGKMPPKDVIVDIMKASDLYNVGADSTYERRASTVTGWVNWILELQR